MKASRAVAALAALAHEHRLAVYRWIADLQGIQWETFLTTGESTVYGGQQSETPSAVRGQSQSCEPAPQKSSSTAMCCA